MPQFDQAEAQVFLIVPHERCRVKSWTEQSDGKVVTLADPGFWASSLYGVAFQMRIHTDTSNTPGTFVIDRKGVLRWAHIGVGPKSWNDRPSVEQTLAKVKELGS